MYSLSKLVPKCFDQTPLYAVHQQDVLLQRLARLEARLVEHLQQDGLDEDGLEDEDDDGLLEVAEEVTESSKTPPPPTEQDLLGGLQ